MGKTRKCRMGISLIFVLLLVSPVASFAQEETKAKDLCVKPAKGPIGVPQAGGTLVAPTKNQSTGCHVIARVGKPAPDFEANAYSNGGFKPIRLSDYRGKWVVLCFYPGDFTFV